MDTTKIRDLAVNAGLLHISPSNQTGRYFIPQMASFSEVVLFARMIEKEREEELKLLRKVEVGG